MLKIQRGPWKVDYEFDLAALHVRPRDDTRWHILSEDCHCIPDVDSCTLYDDDGDRVITPVYLHLALDGRTVRAPRPGC